MAAIDWPSALPPPSEGALQETYVPPFVDDDAQVGASRRRKRFTRTLSSFTMTLFLTTEEKAALKTFIETTTDAGTNIFNWMHPTEGTIYEVKFGKDLPSFSHSKVGFWNASVALDEV